MREIPFQSDTGLADWSKVVRGLMAALGAFRMKKARLQDFGTYHIFEVYLFSFVGFC